MSFCPERGLKYSLTSVRFKFLSGKKKKKSRCLVLLVEGTCSMWGPICGWNYLFARINRDQIRLPELQRRRCSLNQYKNLLKSQPAPKLAVKTCCLKMPLLTTAAQSPGCSSSLSSSCLLLGATPGSCCTSGPITLSQQDCFSSRWGLGVGQ